MTIFGWDMSHYDDPSIGTAVSEGISFITHKAGGDAPDTELAAWWNEVKDLPSSVLLGAYWVLYPGSPASRADAFLYRLDTQCPGWRSRDAFMLQVDAEIWAGNTDTRPSITEINAFCDRLVSATDGKYLPIGYLPKWVYPDVSAFRFPLWASSYVGGQGGFRALYPGDGSARWNGYGKPVSILQYSSNATIGGQTLSDANAFRGTIDDLKSLVGGDMTLTVTDAELVVDRMVARGLGSSQIPTIGVALQSGYLLARDTNTKVSAVVSAVGAILTNVQADDTDQAALLADAQAKYDALLSSLAEIPAEVLAELGQSTPEVAANAIRELLGSPERIAAVKALL